MKSNHSNMLVYLKGINSDDLEHVIEFLYSGVTSIPQEDLKQFLETGKALGLKGLQYGVHDSSSESSFEEKEYKTTQRNEEGYRNEAGVDNDTCESQMPSTVSKDDTIDNIAPSELKAEEIDLEVNTNEEFSKKIEEMIKKISGGWNCNVCGRISTKRQHIQQHAETHVEGISHTCHICSKTFSVKRYLKQHISNTHSESLFSCEFCGKSEMNRGYKYKHKCQKPL